eukprot:6213399-Pleurochrysis_carterae.AAC.1
MLQSVYTCPELVPERAASSPEGFGSTALAMQLNKGQWQNDQTCEQRYFSSPNALEERPIWRSARLFAALSSAVPRKSKCDSFGPCSRVGSHPLVFIADRVA